MDPTGYTPNPSPVPSLEFQPLHKRSPSSPPSLVKGLELQTTPVPILKEQLVNTTEKQPLLGTAESGTYGIYLLVGSKPSSAKAVKERRWVTVLMVVAAAFLSVLSACVLGFPSAALLDLTESESRKEFKFDMQLKDIFGVSV